MQSSEDIVDKLKKAFDTEKDVLGHAQWSAMQIPSKAVQPPIARLCVDSNHMICIDTRHGIALCCASLPDGMHVLIVTEQ